MIFRYASAIATSSILLPIINLQDINMIRSVSESPVSAIKRRCPAAVLVDDHTGYKEAHRTGLIQMNQPAFVICKQKHIHILNKIKKFIIEDGDARNVTYCIFYKPVIQYILYYLFPIHIRKYTGASQRITANSSRTYHNSTF